MATLAMDPYYWTRDIQGLNAQQRALGQSKGMSPQEVSSMIAANFAAQQENETTQRRLQLAERGQNLAEQQQSQAEAQQRRQNVAGTVGGIVQLGMNLPTAIKGYQDIGWAAKPGQQAITGGAGTTGYDPTKTNVPSSNMAISPTSAAAGITGFSPVADTVPGFSPVAGQTALTGQGAAAGGEMGLGAVAGGVGVAGLGYGVGSSVIHGKYSKIAGILGATAAGAAYGSYVGPVGTAAGAAIGFVVGAVESIFGF